jgi:hypothetical protein
MIITFMDVIIVMFLSTIAGILLCEAYHQLLIQGYFDE